MTAPHHINSAQYVRFEVFRNLLTFSYCGPETLVTTADLIADTLRISAVILTGTDPGPAIFVDPEVNTRQPTPAKAGPTAAAESTAET